MSSSGRGRRHLYVLIDLYSRYNPGWIVSPRKDSELAKNFLAEAIRINGAAPHTVHAERVTSMTSKPVSALLVDLNVARSRSRPRVSNDNPFSVAQFKTMKYLHDCPTHFNTVQHARTFCAGFFTGYNYVHRRSGIGWHTPASVHFGNADTSATAARRPSARPTPRTPKGSPAAPTPKIPQQSWINEPNRTTEHLNDEPSHLT